MPTVTRQIRFALALTAVLAAACGTAELARRPAQYRIVAYVYGDRANLEQIGAEKVTHINYAFGEVNEACEIELPADAPSHLARLRSLKARNPRLKVILSVGGWGADNFSDAALTHTTRLQFTQSAVEVLEKYSLDGLDLDWEYPGQPGPGIKHRPEDKRNFTLLLKLLRDRFDERSDAAGRTGHDRYTLSIASSGAPSYFEHTEMDKLHQYLDWINIMTYDFTGSWTSTTGHHAGLYPRRGGGASGYEYVKQHLNAGIPREKLVLGVPFYGKSWTEVNRKDRGLNQPAGCYATEFSFGILTQFINRRGYRRYWDRAARAPYLWNPISRTWITYDDPVSLQHKARFVKKNRLGGVMYWEHSHDPDEILLTTIHSHLRSSG